MDEMVTMMNELMTTTRETRKGQQEYDIIYKGDCIRTVYQNLRTKKKII